MKRILLVFLSTILLISLCACSSTNKAPTGTLEEIMTGIYKGIPNDELPMMLTNTKVDESNVSWYLGMDELNFEEALASESPVGSIAFSLVLVRAKQGQDIKALADEIKASLQPNKWICVGVSEVVIEQRGDVLLVVLSDDKKDVLIDNFKGLK